MSRHDSISSNHTREETIRTVRLGPYFCPIAFLPVSSDWSAISLDSVRVNHEAHMTVRVAVNDALQAATEIINVTQHYVMPVAQLGAHLEHLRRLIRKIYTLLRPKINLLERKYHFERGETVLESAGYHTQNLDYKRMKEAKDQLRSLVQNNKDRLLSNTSTLIYEALLHFREVYIEDMEHHILMAAAKVKLDTSLTQKVYQDALPPGMRLKSALDILREMTNARRKEFFL